MTPHLSNAQRRRQRKQQAADQRQALRPSLPQPIRLATPGDELLETVLLEREGWERLGDSMPGDGGHPMWVWAPLEDPEGHHYALIFPREPGYHVERKDAHGVEHTHDFDTAEELIERLNMIQA